MFSRSGAVWVVVLLLLALTFMAFVNLYSAENAALSSAKEGAAAASGSLRASWVFLLCGIGLSLGVGYYLNWLMRRTSVVEGRLAEELRARQADADFRRRMESEILKQRADLDRRVRERTQELADSNKFLLTEISERKRAQAEQAAERERLMTTLRSITDGVIAVDADSRIVLMNRVAERISGWSQDEAMKKHLYTVFNVADDNGIPYNSIVERILAAGAEEDASKSVVLTDKTGREMPISFSSAPIYDSDATLTGVVIAFRDITELRRIEDERLKTHKLESIALLAGGIAHDYNNLLTAVLGNLSLAQMSVTETPEDVPGLLNEVESASMRAKELTRQLLTFAKGGSPVKTAATLTDIIKDSAEFVLRGSSAKCEFVFAQDTAQCEVDQGQISQVIQNLVINADQAMLDGGKILLRTENIQISADNKTLPLRPGRYVKITVADTGPGMPPEVISKIFEPYFTTKEKGSGLGLTTSFSIVKKHDGFMTLESKVGQGTSFFIYLPASEGDAMQSAGKAQPIVLRGNGRILVMDDDAPIRALLKRMLESVGYKVTAARDGAEAVNLYTEAVSKGQPFDVVMLDLTVPGGIGGREAMRQLLAKYPDVKAVVTSGYANDPVMEKYRKFGFCGMVMKPYTLGELTHTLKRVLG